MKKIFFLFIRAVVVERLEAFDTVVWSTERGESFRRNRKMRHADMGLSWHKRRYPYTEISHTLRERELIF